MDGQTAADDVSGCTRALVSKVHKFWVDLQWQEADRPTITHLIKQSAGGDEGAEAVNPR